ncbi:MAG: DUF192 domain-containing protein [Sneathiella sp.]
MAKKISAAALWCFLSVFYGGRSVNAAADLFVLMIDQKTEMVALNVELSDTPETRAKGLMSRKSLHPEQGMLFDFKKQKRVTMWMKNTFIPLDMIFANEKGVVVYIKYNALPEDLSIVGTKLPARYVLEVNAGFAKTLNVQIGNRLMVPLKGK